MIKAFLIAVALSCLPMHVAAQVALTTFGSTDASECFANARGQFSDDIDPCDRAISDQKSLSKKDFLATLVNRGIIYNRRGELSSAIRDFNEALTMDSALAEAYLNRGNAYFLAERFEEALSDYNTAIEYDVRDLAAAFYNKGLAHLALKDKVSARDALQRALEENANFVQAREKLQSLEEG